MLGHDRRVLASMNWWIDFALAAGNNLKQLVISGEFCCQKCAVGFPLNLRASNTLTTLNLYKCKLVDEGCFRKDQVSEPPKSRLDRNIINFTDIIHNTFLCGPPFLKSLILDAYDGLGRPEVSDLVRITSISVHNCRSLVRRV